jgi:hypothetical protein
MYINLKRLKAPEIRKLAKAYNKLNLIPHPSILKKADLIKYLKEHLETNIKGAVFIDHPKLQKSIKKAIDRIIKEDEEAKQNLEQTIKDIEEDIKKNRPEDKPKIAYRDTLTKEQKAEQDKRFKYFIEKGQIMPTDTEIPISKKEKKELEAREKAVKELLDKEQKQRDEVIKKRNQEIMKKVREQLNEKPKSPTKKKKVEEEQPEEEEEEDETAEEKKMRLYFASIKDPVERKKQVNKWLLSQRQRLKEKAEKS